MLFRSQNAIAGLTNRWLVHIADMVLAGFPAAFGERSGVRTVGNPVRPEIVALAAPEVRLAERHGRLRLLIVGGSQGAQIFNQIIPDAVRGLAEAQRPQVWHQTGKRDEATVAAAYGAFLPDAKVAAFIEDMAAAYAWADLVVCRAGAMTVAELAAAGVASILVPFARAADDHQTVNARFLEVREAAVLLPQAEFSGARLTALLTSFAVNHESLARMAAKARACAIPDATATVAQLCREAAHA